jgi:hypothetical protein
MASENGMDSPTTGAELTSTPTTTPKNPKPMHRLAYPERLILEMLKLRSI